MMNTGQVLLAFPRLRVLVVGDVCLDRWCRYDPALADPSRETGIPRIGVVSAEVTPGAAGTVASNVAALKAGKIAVMGIVGEDGFGHELLRALADRCISSDLLIPAPGVPTFTYTKLINIQTDQEDLPRVDFVNNRPIPEEIERRLVASFGEAASGFDVIIVSDQAETSQGGVITPAMRDAISRVAVAHPQIVMWVDSRMRTEQFRDVVVKSNAQEAEAASMRLLGRFDPGELRKQMRAKYLVVTHGPRGALIVHGGGAGWVRTKPVDNPVDICGAGDSFSAGAAMALKVTGDPNAAARVGNLVAAVTIMKKGTGTASPEEVLRADR